MKGLLHRKLTKKGFTLAELLIVVAILAILVAVSIPIFTTKLADAKKATDEANLRACKALVANAIITGEFPETQWKVYGATDACDAIYDAEKGCLVPTGTAVKGYGKGSKIKGITNAPAGETFYDMINNSGDSFVAQENGYLAVSVLRESQYYVIYWIPTV